MANLPGGTCIPQLFGDDGLLVAEVHKGLHDRLGMRHIKVDFWELIIDTLETLHGKQRTKWIVQLQGETDKNIHLKCQSKKIF